MEFVPINLRTTPGAPAQSSAVRLCGVGLTGGGQGGSPRHPPAHIACKSVKRARTFCAQHKSLAACADLLPLACFPGSECGVTPLPQFPRPYEPPCKPQPAAASVPHEFALRAKSWGPPRAYKERSGPPIFPRRGNVGVSSAHPPGVGGQHSSLPPCNRNSTTTVLPP